MTCFPLVTDTYSPLPCFTTFSSSYFRVEFAGDSLSQELADWSEGFGNDLETTASEAAQETPVECS